MGIFLNEHIVKKEVLKHGSHNQLSHGRRGGGKGGSGAGGGDSKPNTMMSDEFIDTKGNEVSRIMQEASVSLTDELEGLRERADNAVQIKALTSATVNVEGAMKDFMGARKLKGKQKIGKIQSGVNKYESALDKISGLEIYRMNVDQVIQNAYTAIPETIRELGIESSLDI